ncbi:MAG: hypothetical protein AB7T49_14570 [Oligoflexales bacterium]
MKIKILSIIKPLLVVLVGLVLVSCSKESKGEDRRYSRGSATVAANQTPTVEEQPNEQPRVDQDKISLEEFNLLIGNGIWEMTLCPPLAEGGSIFLTNEFKDNKHYFSSFDYSDDNCQQKTESNIWEYTYSLGKFADYLNVPKAFEIDFVLLSAKRILHTQELVDEYNAQSMYGYTDWAINQPKDVTGRKSLPTSTSSVEAAGTLSFDVIAIVDGYLTTGNTDTSGVGTSPVNRPKSLFNALVYTKK